MRGVSERTVQRDWEKARIYLHRVLHGADAGGMMSSVPTAVSDLLIGGGLACAALDRDRWQRASPHLDRVLDLPPADREAWLARCAREDPTSPPTSRRCSPSTAR